jgi:hypothetical protein
MAIGWWCDVRCFSARKDAGKLQEFKVEPRSCVGFLSLKERGLATKFESVTLSTDWMVSMMELAAAVRLGALVWAPW